MTSLELYKGLKKDGGEYNVAFKLLCYVSIDAYIENPTDEEMEVISDIVINAYLKSQDDMNLSRLCDIVSEKYSNKEYTLDELKSMSKWDILDLYY